MALTLPGWLVKALHYLGQDFPQTNEDTLYAWASEFRTLGSNLRTSESDLQGAIRHVASHNQGPAVEAFNSAMTAPDNNLSNLTEFIEACDMAATGCDLCAKGVVVLKGVVLFQLGLMAAALATGPGAFLVRKGVEFAINKAVEYLIQQVLEG